MSEAVKSFGPFLESIERAESLEGLRSTFLTATEHLGFKYAALFPCSGAEDLLQGEINFTRIPAAWHERYYEQKYWEIDPVFMLVRQRVTPYSWSDPDVRRDLTPAQNALLDECDDMGMAGGIAYPIWGPGSRTACCALVPDPDGVDPNVYPLAYSLASFAYSRARSTLDPAVPRVFLSKRERECLLLAAKGKSDWAIGELLGISARTVHHTIERAKTRYAVTTRVQAIVRAMAAGEFSPTDALMSTARPAPIATDS